MNNNVTIQRALISVSNKVGIVEFATDLHDFGVEIISTGGTANVLKQANIPVTNVDSLTGFPEMLDGRVKTLHPVIHGGLLGVRDEPTHVAAMEKHNINPIDLICIDLYPFEETIKKSDVSESDIIEQIDIGGPAMIRSAAKNHRFVTVVTDPTHYSLVLADMNSNNGETTHELRIQLAKYAFTRTADYDTTISQWMDDETEEIPSHLRINGLLEQTLRYGENPNQLGAVYRDVRHSGPSVVTAKVVSGKPLSYNNLVDAAAALELVQDLHSATNNPSAAIIKHANPCGAAVADSINEAVNGAWLCDPLAAFGGIVSVSHKVDVELSHTITQGEKFLEVIVAPSFDDDAIKLLSDRWKNIRLLAVGNEKRNTRWHQLKSVEGGILVQDNFPITTNPEDWDHAAGPTPTKCQLINSHIAWICCGHLKSNSISIVDNKCLIGGGMGQVDRLSAARLAIQRAGSQLTEAKSPVAGSDAFFPFSDGPKLLIEAGIKCIVQPGGSVRDQETIDLCNDKEITLLHTATRLFKH
ncbi:MAG: bifunctional phosphoribosylaminoimidazolecarboxamide formyltransferase/IMP cyclohydrolase [Phycisphaerales bacterium]|jgi:phosphoribosylaminoimidazolecarboxamide formyltransferase/IMP cyclohydrolase|nr:bifunctional phosphoribosylaminoimidazolecarboxamide formyltransferase/IMP cyclohydrolase [Phycisphaerales bacterium]